MASTCDDWIKLGMLLLVGYVVVVGVDAANIGVEDVATGFRDVDTGPRDVFTCYGCCLRSWRCCSWCKGWENRSCMLLTCS